MKILLRCRPLRLLWLTKLSGRHFHGDHQSRAPLTAADFEAINLCDKSVPKTFNFAGDVLDQWSQKEKV